MAKKNGKAAPQTEAPAEENQQAADEKKIFLNNVSDKMIHDNVGKDGKTYKAVSFQYGKDDAGNPVYASFLVNPGQVLPSTRSGKDNVRVDNPGFKNILLGKDAELNVSVNAKDENGKFIQTKMLASEIKQRHNDFRKEYQAAQKAAKDAAKETGREVPDIETEAPDIEAEAEA